MVYRVSSLKSVNNLSYFLLESVNIHVVQLSILAGNIWCELNDI